MSKTVHPTRVLCVCVYRMTTVYGSRLWIFRCWLSTAASYYSSIRIQTGHLQCYRFFYAAVKDVPLLILHSQISVNICCFLVSQSLNLNSLVCLDYDDGLRRWN